MSATMMPELGRRALLKSAALTALAAALPKAAFADGGPVKLGALVPLSGSGGPYGPPMAKVAKGVIDQVNAAGGIGGRKIELTVEDDETNPEAAVRAAHKLIDVDKVVCIMGTWASAVTTAVAPLCWQSKTFLTTTSGADSITLLPHQGYLIRTQPNTTLQGHKFGEFAVEQHGKRVFFATPQTPFVKTQFDGITAAVKKAGGDTKLMVYDDKKPSYRSEVDEILRFKPDAIIFGGYSTDTSVMLKDVFRSDFNGAKIAFGYSVNQKLVESLPKDVVEGIFTISPSTASDSKAYAKAAKLSGMASPDPYTSQVYDQVNLVILALTIGGGAMDGTTIKDNIRKVSQAPGGEKVDDALDGMKLIAQKKPVDYDGASGPCDFTDIGDIIDCKFRYEQVKDGKITLLRIA
jgi:branched-chain amino acid transport system substrate-binding protein